MRNKIDYPYYTPVGGNEIHESIKSEVDVAEYYRCYGRGSFIWHKSWKDAYRYVMDHLKGQKLHLQQGIRSIEDRMAKLKVENKIIKLKGELV